MKRFAIALILVFTFCDAGRAVLMELLDAPGDDKGARGEVWNEPDLELFNAEYHKLVETRVLPLKIDDVKKVFGPVLSQIPNDLVLPLCVGSGIMVSGANRFTAQDKSHEDFHSMGPSGVVRCFYGLNGTNLQAAVFYFRKDSNFVPLKSATNFTERLEWEKGKFRAMKNWLGEHLPKVRDLGVVEVLASGFTRVNLGAGATCITQAYPDNGPSLAYRFIIDVNGHGKSITETNQVIGFSSAGKYYLMVPKFVEELQETNSVSAPLL
jgi:hypothetical protein